MNVRVMVDGTLAAEELRRHAWWYGPGEILPGSPAKGHAALEVGGGVELRSDDPAVWRAFAAAAAQVADELAALYAEHGVEPPAVDQ